MPVTRAFGPQGFVADLPGYRRTWDVAMENLLDIPGYKYYVDPDTGQRPPIHVAFLDIARDDRGSVNGVCVPVTSQELAALDRREQQYERSDLGHRFPLLDGPVWVYVGSPSGRARRRAGDRAGTTVVHREYLERVVAAFEALGPAERRRFDASTTACGCPIVDLTRRTVPDRGSRLPH